MMNSHNAQPFKGTVHLIFGNMGVSYLYIKYDKQLTL